MARYILRNKDKIEKAYDKKILDRIVKSLDVHFKENEKIELEDMSKYRAKSDDYGKLSINDEGHTCGLIIFYVIEITFDVHRLAFVEFVN